jgi:hypothetical protein
VYKRGNAVYDLSMTTNKHGYTTPSEDTGWTCDARRRMTHDAEITKVRIIDLPVGAHVAYTAHGTVGSKYVWPNSVVGTVGKPEVLDDGMVVCKYRDCIGAWDWVGPETEFFLVSSDTTKKLSVPARNWLEAESLELFKAALEATGEFADDIDLVDAVL